MADKKPKKDSPRDTKPDTIRSELSALWQNTDGSKAFIAALEERGYLIKGGATPNTGSAVDIAASSSDTYEAFRLYKRKRKLYRIGIRAVDRAWERVVYSHLTRIAQDQTHGKALTLVFSTFMVVVIRGRNLLPIADAIDLEICEFVQQYDPARWAMPQDKSAPFIESMEFYYPGNHMVINTEPPPAG